MGLSLAHRIYIDSNVFIELLEGLPGRVAQLRALFAVLKARPMQLVTSEFTLAEIRGKESPRVGWQDQSNFYLDLIVWSRFIDLRPVSRDILWATGDFRRQAKTRGRSLALPDAIHIATAVRSHCDHVISADIEVCR